MIIVCCLCWVKDEAIVGHISLIHCYIVLYWFCSPIAPLLFPFWVTIW